MTNSESQYSLPVLLYHYVGVQQPGSYPYLTVSAKEFRNQIEWLLKHQYQFLTLSEFLAAQNGKTSPHRKSVLLTFDDAFADLEENALPILNELGISATIFVVTSQIGGTNAWEKQKGWTDSLRLLSEEQIRHWSSQGIQFGAHSHFHKDLRQLSQVELKEELLQCKSNLEQIIGEKIFSFAYPFGAYNESVRISVSQVFDLAFTTKRGLNHQNTDRYELCRTAPQSSDSDLEMWLRVRMGWTPADRFRNFRNRFHWY
jgi:peptidoglycan/xylan/chitin deacetylase (PgdA/CDA1 family)